MELKNAIKARRSNYDLTKEMTLGKAELEKLLADALEHSPTGFNSQSSRIVLALGAEHELLWNLILKGIENEIGGTPAFVKSKEKIDSLRQSAGTILFYEDVSIGASIKTKFPLYAHNVDKWAEQSQGMLTLAVWTLLAEAGMGASLQHYGELIEKPLREAWNLALTWRLVGQMPFGTPKSLPAPKTKIPGANRLIVKN